MNGNGEGSIRPGGAVVFWATSESDRGKLMAGLAQLGWEKFTPEAKTPYHALLDAAKAVYSGWQYLHRGTEKNSGVEVVEEVKGQERNEYRHVDTLAVDEATGLLLECQRPDAIRAAYDKARTNIPANAVTALLVRAVAHLGGLALRPSGGFYWVKESATAQFRDVAAVAEQASVSGATRVYALRVAHDASSVRAITDALRSEVEQEVSRISADIAEGEIGKRALEGRKASALALREKVKELSGILGVALDDLTGKLETVECAAADAVLSLASEGVAKIAAEATLPPLLSVDVPETESVQCAI